MLFEHKKKSDNYYNLNVWPIFLFPLIGMLYLWGLEVGIWIKIIGGILLVMTSIGLYKNTPFAYDRIIVTEKSLIIQEKTKRQTVQIEDIELFKSNSKLSIMMKNGNKIEVSYSNWMMSVKKINELNDAIRKSIEKNTTDNNGYSSMPA